MFPWLTWISYILYIMNVTCQKKKSSTLLSAFPLYIYFRRCYTFIFVTLLFQLMWDKNAIEGIFSLTLYNPKQASQGVVIFVCFSWLQVAGFFDLLLIAGNVGKEVRRMVWHQDVQVLVFYSSSTLKCNIQYLVTRYLWELKWNTWGSFNPFAPNKVLMFKVVFYTVQGFWIALYHRIESTVNLYCDLCNSACTVQT